MKEHQKLIDPEPLVRKLKFILDNVIPDCDERRRLIIKSILDFVESQPDASLSDKG